MAGKNPSVNASEAQPIDFGKLEDEMDGVKRLLMLLLAKLGSDSGEIAMAMGVDDSTVRRIISFRKVKRICPSGNGKTE